MKLQQSRIGGMNVDAMSAAISVLMDRRTIRKEWRW